MYNRQEAKLILSTHDSANRKPSFGVFGQFSSTLRSMHGLPALSPIHTHTHTRDTHLTDNTHTHACVHTRAHTHRQNDLEAEVLLYSIKDARTDYK